MLGYLGRPIPLAHLLYETDSSLVRQAYSPRMMAVFLNLAGFGMTAWDSASGHPDEPFTYKVTTLPLFDRNLRNLAQKISPTCLLAHVRGVTDNEDEVIAEQNLHPFRFHDVNVTLAHNGHLREFARMRYDLVEHVRPEFIRRIEGTTDSEWIYALILSQLEDPYGMPEAAEIVDATVKALSIIRAVRERNGIETSSPLNLFLSTGRCLVATRFSFDYGWYPDNDTLLETDLPYVSLWYTLGHEYVQRAGEWTMVGSDRTSSLLIASEPLTSDISSWLEAPEYSLLSASITDGVFELEVMDLAV
ncbi:MAG: class II glutamine amidotransferase [Gaiellaceae bacterium]